MSNCLSAKKSLCLSVFFTGLVCASGALADGSDAAAKLAALLQDPLANISAVMTDNTASFKSAPITTMKPMSSIFSRSIPLTFPNRDSP